MLKFIFNLITEPLGLPIAWYWEWLIMLVIGAIAFALAYGIVGIMYDNGEISGRSAGSICHWAIRIICFLVLLAIAYGIIAFVKWLFDNWIIVVSVLGGLILIGTIFAMIIIVHRKRGEKTKNATDEK